jgi:integrase
VVRKEITHELLQNLPTPPEGKRKLEVVSTSKNYQGLYLEIHRGGNVTWRFRYKSRITGKTTHLRIGNLEAVPLEAAFTKAREYRQRLDAGLEPVVEEMKPQGVPQLSEFFPEYLKLAAVRKKDGGKKDEELWGIRLKGEFGHLRLDAITRQHVQTYLTSLVSKHGLRPATANRTVSLLRRILNIALDWDVIEKNPIARVKLLPENNKSDRYMTPEEMARLMAVLKTYPARLPCQVAMLLLATGARLSEALNATWVNIDRVQRLWKIPASDSKSGRVRSVPLNDSAIEVLDQLGTEGKYEHLWVKGDGERYRYMHQVWGRIRKKAGLEWVTLHRLRHQHAALLVQSGRTLFEAQAILGHSDPSMTMRYAHLSTKVLQDASDEVSKAIATAVQRAG